VRYLAGCAALGLTVLAPVVTFLHFAVGPMVRSSHMGSVAAVAIPDHWQPTDYAPQAMAGWSTSFQTGMGLILPWIVLLWVLGCIRGTVKLATDWGNMGKLMTETLTPLPEAIAQQCQKLARRLGIRRAVHLGESALVTVPSVVGWISPVILVPFGAFSDLSGVQIEALLAHELAHICRHDFFVNFLQSIT
jgi:beta-lactamase regulating signal transducer with metallopeptidase domain